MLSKKQIKSKMNKVVDYVKENKLKVATAVAGTVGVVLLTKSKKPKEESIKVVEENTIIEPPEHAWYQGTNSESTWTLDKAVDEDAVNIALELLDGKFERVDL